MKVPGAATVSLWGSTTVNNVPLLPTPGRSLLGNAHRWALEPCQVGQRYLEPHLTGSPRQAGWVPIHAQRHCLITWNPGHWQCSSHTQDALAERAHGMLSLPAPKRKVSTRGQPDPSLCGVFRLTGLVSVTRQAESREGHGSRAGDGRGRCERACAEGLLFSLLGVLRSWG